MAVVDCFLIKNQVSIFNDLGDALYLAKMYKFLKNKNPLVSLKDQEGDVCNCFA